MKRLPVNTIDNYLLIAFMHFYIVGIILHSIDVFFDFALAITEFFLLFVNTSLIVYIYCKTRNVKFLFVIFTIIFLTVILEIIGVSTGYIFGAYHYSNLWKITIAGVPVVIGINWLAFLLASSSINQTITPIRNPFVSALLTGIFIVILDFFLEKVAIRLGYWYWHIGYVPLQNYAIWFGIGFFVQVVFNQLKLNIKTRLLNVYYIINLAFFIILLLVTK